MTTVQIKPRCSTPSAAAQAVLKQEAVLARHERHGKHRSRPEVPLRNMRMSVQTALERLAQDLSLSSAGINRYHDRALALDRHSRPSSRISRNSVYAGGAAYRTRPS